MQDDTPKTHSIVVEGMLFSNMEDIMEILLSGMQAIGLDLRVFSEDMTRKEITAKKNWGKGYADALKTLVEEYLVHDVPEARRIFWSNILTRLEAILDTDVDDDDVCGVCGESIQQGKCSCVADDV